MKKYFAEFIGTAALVLFGCGSATIGGLIGLIGSNEAISPLGLVGVGLAFGLTVMGMVYAIGPISGCHINPAVTVGVFTAGRMPAREVPGYIIAQLLGGLTGALVLYAILLGRAGGWDLATNGLGQNGWGPGFMGGYTITSALIVEVVATFVFVMVILGATSAKGATIVAGLAIGLTLSVIHIVFIRVTGTSVNPARSLAPALLIGGQAIEQVWLFLTVPFLGAILAGLLFRFRMLEP